VKDLNDFHRPSSGERSRVNIHTAIDEMLLLVKNRVEKRKIILQLNYAEDMPPVLIVSDQFKQVILNLLTNAEESIAENQENGRITIITERVDSNIIVQVQDNGVGIREEIIDSIFEPFVTTKARVKGVGLGLSITHGIVKSHGGEIVVTSTVGKGSTFKVILPVTRGERHEQ
jgi:signal transduction histidine kinase